MNQPPTPTSEKDAGLILVDLPPEVRRTLSAQAAAYPLEDEDYASRLLRGAVESLAQAPTEEVPSEAPVVEVEAEPTPVEEMCSAAQAFKACRQLMGQILSKFKGYGFNSAAYDTDEDVENFHTLIDHLCAEGGPALAERALIALGHMSAPQEATQKGAEEEEEEEEEEELGTVDPPETLEEGTAPPMGMVGNILRYLREIYPDGENIEIIAEATGVTRKQAIECLSVLKRQGGVERSEDETWTWTGEEEVLTHTPKIRFEDSGAVEAIQKLHAMGVVYAAGSQIANGMGRSHNSMSKMLQSLERKGIITRDGMFPTGGIRWRIDPDELADWVARIESAKPTAEVQEEIDDFSTSLKRGEVVPLATDWSAVIDEQLKDDPTIDRVLEEEALRFAHEELVRIAQEKEEIRLIEQQKEAARLAEEEARLAEEIRLAEEAEKVAEAARLADKAEKDRLALEAEREARRLVKEAEKAKVAETLRLAAEAEKAEKLRLEEEARRVIADQKAKVEADAKKFRAETEVRFQTLVNEYNSMLESGKPWGEYEKAVQEEAVRACATALGMKPEVNDINTEGWLVNHLFVWGGESFNFTVRYKLLKLGGVADPLWNALDRGELDYKQAWKVVSRYKRAMKKKGAPTTGNDLMLKLMVEVKTPSPDSSPASQESFGEVPSASNDNQEPVLTESAVEGKRALRPHTPKQYALPTLPATLPVALSAATVPVVSKEAAAEGKAMAARWTRKVIRREIILTYTDLYNKPLNDRQLVTAVSRNLPKAHHPDILSERDQLVSEGIMIPALKKGAYTLDKQLAFEVSLMLDSKVK